MSIAPDWDALADAAWRARERAYAPYSKYKVGAALAAEDGRVFVGCNVENASYGLCLCAERSAHAAAVAAGARRFVGIVVVTGGDEPGSPCGMCRQVLAELGPPFAVRCISESGRAIDTSTQELLPFAFGPSALGVVAEDDDPARSTMLAGSEKGPMDTDRPPAPGRDTQPPQSNAFAGVALKVAAGTGVELAEGTQADGSEEPDHRGRS